eukprot:15513891-Heterocapsa_arctica.AAC.1
MKDNQGGWTEAGKTGQIGNYSLAGLEKHQTRGRSSRQSRHNNANWAISLSEARDTSTISPN